MLVARAKFCNPQSLESFWFGVLGLATLEVPLAIPNTIYNRNSNLQNLVKSACLHFWSEVLPSVAVHRTTLSNLPDK